MKTLYKQPAMIVVTLHHQTHLMEGTSPSPVSNVSGNAGFTFGGAGDKETVIRTKESSNIWDEEW